MAPPNIFIPPRKDILGRRVVKLMEPPLNRTDPEYGIVIDACFVPAEDVRSPPAWHLLVDKDGIPDIWEIPKKDHPEGRGPGYIIRFLKSDASTDDWNAFASNNETAVHQLAGLIGFTER